MKYKIPSIRALQAFEASARLCNFSHAARELYTSQPAISRHIACLESQLKVSLFNRYNRKLSLTIAGQQYYRSVASGLESLHTASLAVSNFTNPDSLTIACTHEISHLFLMPRFEQLQQKMGSQVMIRIMTFEYEDSSPLMDARIDIKLAYQLDRDIDKNFSCVVLPEAIKPVCSPAFAKINKAQLSKPVSTWGELPFLKIARDNSGWATWEDWFNQMQIVLNPVYLSFYNYIYLLEATTSGSGIALGWNGLIDRYLDDGRLISLSNKFVQFDRGLYAGLTPQGQQRPLAQQCLDYLSSADKI